jgi:hypothetical protein
VSEKHLEEGAVIVKIVAGGVRFGSQKEQMSCGKCCKTFDDESVVSPHLAAYFLHCCLDPFLDNVQFLLSTRDTCPALDVIGELSSE